MKISPWILGAAIAVPVAGAWAGSSIGTEPLGVTQDVSALLPARPINTATAPLHREQLPNHYALETPDGVVEVSELAIRGRDPEGYRRTKAMEAAYEAEMTALEAEMARGYSDYANTAYVYVQQPAMRAETRSYAPSSPQIAVNAVQPTTRYQAAANPPAAPESKPASTVNSAAGYPPAPLQNEVSTIASGARIVNVTAALNQ